MGRIEDYVFVKEWATTRDCTELVSRVVPKINKLYKKCSDRVYPCPKGFRGIPLMYLVKPERPTNKARWVR